MEYEVASTVEDAELVEKRRRQIVAAATKLFGSDGFDRTTIKSIAKLAGISPGLVYQYVTDKEDVLLLVLIDIVETYSRELPLAIAKVSDPLQRCIVAFDAYCRIVHRLRPAIVLAYRASKSLSRERRALIQKRELETNQIITDLVIDCVKNGYIRSVNEELFTYHLVVMAHSWALKSWRFKEIMELDEYIEMNLDILFNGVLTVSGKKKWDAARKS